MRLSHISSRRGNALVLSVLILLALTSVGLISMQRTNSDLMVSGNVVRAAQAQMAGQAGVTHAMADIRRHLFDYMLDFRAAEKPELEMKAMSTALTNDETGLPYIDATQDEEKSIARAAQSIAYQVEAIGGVGEIQDMPGYEVGEVCFQVFDFNSMGGLPVVAGESVDDTMSQRDTVVVRYRARVVIGPTKCERR